MRHGAAALPRHRRARRCRRPVHGALSREADLRHPGLSPHRGGRAGGAAEGAGSAVPAGLSPRRAGAGPGAAERRVLEGHDLEGHRGAGARRDHRRRRRRLRSQPAAVAGHRGLRGQERLLLCHPSRGLPRQARGDRGRRRHRRRLGAVAGRDRRPRLGDPSPRQVPRRARERGAAQGARQVRQARSRGARISFMRWRAPQASSRR